MARTFQKFTEEQVEPKKVEVESEKKSSVPVEKTLRFNHHAIQMADMIENGSRKVIEKPQEEQEADHDKALITSMCYMMKGLRGMMQLARVNEQ